MTALPTSLSIIGLGKLGSSMAAAFASKGFSVMGVDNNPNVIKAINDGLAPVVEPHLDELIAKHKNLIHASHDYQEAVAKSDITFLVLPTPSDDRGCFSLRYLETAIRAIGEQLRKKTGFHTVVITSTVLPGSTDFVLKTLLESTSGRTCGRDVGLCYNPEFIALGSVIHDFLNPDFVLIGESDESTGQLLSDLYQKVCDNKPKLARMNFINAELTKISINTYVTTKITFANMIAQICEQLPGGDVDVVTKALGLDSRIGARYLKGGTGFGGPCFPRDNKALSFLYKQLGRSAGVAECTDRFNQEYGHHIVDRIQSKVVGKPLIAVLGLSYKPDSNIVEESQALLIVKGLADRGFQVIVYDPLALEPVKKIMGDRIQYASSTANAIEKSSFVVLATPDAAFLTLRPTDFKTRPVHIYDCWRMLRPHFLNTEGIHYHSLGIEDTREVTTERLQSFWST